MQISVSSESWKEMRAYSRGVTSGGTIYKGVSHVKWKQKWWWATGSGNSAKPLPPLGPKGQGGHGAQKPCYVELGGAEPRRFTFNLTIVLHSSLCNWEPEGKGAPGAAHTGEKVKFSSVWKSKTQPSHLVAGKAEMGKVSCKRNKKHYFLVAIKWS